LETFHRILDETANLQQNMHTEVIVLVAQVAKWGETPVLRMDKRVLGSLGLSVGDTVNILKCGDDIVVNPEHGIDWYLQDYERPSADESWEHLEPKGREKW
jgi:antitoxin component of MazEF toxin-antitoxin module